jgi:exopolyphosphatase/guanosine-5'-triphosphate,3'-diphosphate pyrophosphatase
MSIDRPAVAAIDVGTSTILILIAFCCNTKFEIIYENEFIVRLGEGLDKNGAISPKALQRAISALNQIRQILSDNRVQRIHAVGTEVFRRAANRDQVLGDIKKRAGFDIQVISGASEAAFTFTAVNHFHPGDRDRMIIDIGGGSTEIITGSRGRFQGSISLPMGASILTEDSLKNAPAFQEQLASARRRVLSVFTAPMAKLSVSEKPELFGVAGTVTTLASMIMEMDVYLPDKVEGTVISREDISKAISRIAPMDMPQRREITGVNPDRAPIFLGGLCILEVLMEILGAGEMTVSNAGVRHGLILSGKSD